MSNKELVAVVFMAINLAMLALAGLDKLRAKRNEYRISEKILLLGGLLGGAGGVLSAMVLFRHKTQKKKFRIGMPLLFFSNMIGVYLILFRLL